MKKSHIIFFTILIFATLFLMAVIIYSNQPINLRNSLLNALPALNDSPTISAADYQQNLINVLEKFLQNKSFLTADSSQRLEALQLLEQDILALRVPGEYKDLHLKLVIAINKLITQQAEEIAQSRSLIEEQINLYQWLKPVLSLFLINLY